MPAQDSSHDASQIWADVTEELASSLPPATFDLWLRPIRATAVHGETLLLSAPETVRRWVERRYAGHVHAALAKRAPAVTRISFDAKRGEESRPVPGDPIPTPVDPAHTFERFVIGPGNRLAHAAALAVAELPGEAYNPLFIHGPPGLGKTHLLGATAEYLGRVNPQLNVHLTTAERFTGEFVAAMRADGPERFKQRYRNLDALLIDDVQVLEGKPRTEEEFVHTFNALHSAGKQIVLCGDRPPEALEQLAQRLRDRFSWGLTVAIEPPDLRTRMALLWRMAARSAPELPEPLALQEIAGRVPSNVRLLEGAMTRVVAMASVLSEPITTPLVRKALEPGPAPGAGGRSAEAPSVDAIQDAVSSVLHVSRAEMASARRSARVSRARQLAMYLARELTPLSLAQIAREFDRDHTTVIHAIRSVSKRLEPGSETADAIHKVRHTLGRTGEAEGGPGGSVPDPPTDPQA
jgi:chromosomal replication initiator protein